MGIVFTIPNAFKSVLNEIVVLNNLKVCSFDFTQHFMIQALNENFDSSISSEM